MTEKSETLHPIYKLGSPWKEGAHEVWLASSLTLHRNFAKYKFPSRLDKVREHQVISLVFDTIKKYENLKNPVLFRAEELSPIEKEFLVEHFFATHNFQQAHGGEGFIIDDTGEFLAVINIEDHLQLTILDTRQEIEKSWNRMIKIEEHVEKSIDMAFNSRFGFLSPLPSRTGTGLVITLFLHIPAVIHSGELAELLEKDKEEEVEATGLQGKSDEMIGDILVARNTCTLGLTEEYILTSLRMWATRAVVAEVTMRKKLLEGDSELIKNKIARAFGLLTHSYQLETVEALNAFSLVKLGIELGWIESKTKLNLNQIFFNCKRAHLMHHFENKVTITDLPKKRAEYLHEVAKNLTLVI